MRTFTRALRVPSLVGKMPGGGSWPGGPYTITQVVGAALVVIGGLQTIEIWGRFGWLLDRVALLAVAAAVGVALQVVKPGGRDPLSAGLAVFGLYGSPRWGRHHGRSVRLRRPHRARHRLLVLVPAATAGVAAGPASPAERPAPPPPAAPFPPRPTPRPAEGTTQPASMHGVAALLAAATSSAPVSGSSVTSSGAIPVPRHGMDGGRR